MTPRYLPKGLHRLRVIQPGAQAQAGLRLSWEGPSTGGAEPVAAENLFTVTPDESHGLLGTYYAGSQWDGPALFQRIDPDLQFEWSEDEPTRGPFSVSWQGQIDIPSAGRYLFQVDAD